MCVFCVCVPECYVKCRVHFVMTQRLWLCNSFIQSHEPVWPLSLRGKAAFIELSWPPLYTATGRGDTVKHAVCRHREYRGQHLPYSKWVCSRCWSLCQIEEIMCMDVERRAFLVFFFFFTLFCISHRKCVAFDRFSLGLNQNQKLKFFLDYLIFLDNY